MLKGRFDPSCLGAVCKEGLPFFLEYSMGFINMYKLKILIYTELRECLHYRSFLFSPPLAFSFPLTFDFVLGRSFASPTTSGYYSNFSYTYWTIQTDLRANFPSLN